MPAPRSVKPSTSSGKNYLQAGSNVADDPNHPMPPRGVDLEANRLIPAQIFPTRTRERARASGPEETLFEPPRVLLKPLHRTAAGKPVPIPSTPAGPRTHRVCPTWRPILGCAPIAVHERAPIRFVPRADSI